MHKSLRVKPGFSLATVDPGSTPGSSLGKKAGAKALADGAAEFADLQERLFAESIFGGTRSVLLVLQATDSAGKGGIVEHVIGQLNPQGIKTHSFKAPTDAEKRHDFLWRIRKELPEPGQIGVFDRSHYEDVLIHRVRGFSPLAEIEKRYDLITAFEQELVASGTTIVKVMLHISPEEQKARLTERLDNPDKNWKYNPGDLEERTRWTGYMEAYEIALNRTSTDSAPWYVVPANHKWYARLAVQHLLLDALRSLELKWPPATYNVEAEKQNLREA